MDRNESSDVKVDSSPGNKTVSLGPESPLGPAPPPPTFTNTERTYNLVSTNQGSNCDDTDSSETDDGWEKQQWQQAFEKAKTKLPKHKFPDMDVNSAESLTSVIDYAKKLQEDQKKWTIRCGGKDRSVEDEVRKVLNTVQMYAPLADTFLGNSLEVSRLVWGSFRALLQVCTGRKIYFLSPIGNC